MEWRKHVLLWLLYIYNLFQPLVSILWKQYKAMVVWFCLSLLAPPRKVEIQQLGLVAQNAQATLARHWCTHLTCTYSLKKRWGNFRGARVFCREYVAHIAFALGNFCPNYSRQKRVAIPIWSFKGFVWTFEETGSNKLHESPIRVTGQQL